MRCNILITSAGRRGVLVNHFQNELRRFFPDGKVFGGDLNPSLSSACCLADGSFHLSPVRSAEYIPHLLDICEKHDVRLVVPTIDTELIPLAEHRALFEQAGISVLISDLSLVRACRDKRLTNQLFSEIGLDAPRVVQNPACGDLPLFAKPYDGSCSIDTHVLRCADDLTPNLIDNPRMIFSEYLDPHENEEYTIDMYFDREGQLKCLVPRLRLETRGGEVSKGRTVRLAETTFMQAAFKNIRGARGCITAQVFRHKHTARIAAIEINPRFGGGYPLSYQAGANFPKWLLEEYVFNKPIEYFDDWETDLTMLRYDGQVFVRGAAA